MARRLRLPGAVSPPNGSPDALDWNHDLTLAESKEISGIISKKKLVDYISVSGESNSSVWGYFQNHGDETVEPVTFRHLSREIRAAVDVPVILAGRITTIDQAEEVLASGDCDAVAMARALIADGELLEKTLYKSTISPVRPCIGCNISCVGNTWLGREIRCIYDPLGSLLLKHLKSADAAYLGRSQYLVGYLPNSRRFMAWQIATMTHIYDKLVYGLGAARRHGHTLKELCAARVSTKLVQCQRHFVTPLVWVARWHMSH